MDNEGKYEIMEHDKKHVIRYFYKDGKKKHEMIYPPRRDGDEIQLVAFEDMKKLVLLEKNKNNYKTSFSEIRDVSGGSTWNLEYINGGRFRGFVERKIVVEHRGSYDGPYYSAYLQMSTNNMDPLAGEFSFRSSNFATPKSKKNAQEVLTNLLLDILQLKK